MIVRAQTYSLKEIAIASNIKYGTLLTRAKRLRKAGILPPVEPHRKTMYTYEQAKALMRTPEKRGAPRLAAINSLKRQMINDGYSVRK